MKEKRNYYPFFAKSLLKAFDYSDSAFSPPADDTFFLIRYPKHQENQGGALNKEGFRPINELFGHSSATNPTDAYASRDSRNVDFMTEPKIIIANKPNPIKHQRSEDETRNISAVPECGRSIVSVANQIMSSTFGKSHSSDTPHQQVDVAQKSVSKSLPATPLTSPSGTPDSSPRTRRRNYGNRFFTGAFVPSEGGERKNGWLLSSILGQSRELVTPKIEEEEELTQEAVPPRAMSRKKSISSQNLTYIGENNGIDKNAGVKVHSILKPKPSELREMNFWSPTSM